VDRKEMRHLVQRRPLSADDSAKHVAVEVLQTDSHRPARDKLGNEPIVYQCRCRDGAGLYLQPDESARADERHEVRAHLHAFPAARAGHGFAPFVGGTAGVAWAEETPADTSGYRFGTRAVLAPLLGFRFFPGQRIHFRVDARWLFWQLKYPSSYFDEPADDPAGPGERSHAVLAGHHAEEWTGGAEYRFGIGFSF